MPKLAWIVMLATLAATPAAAQTAIPDVRGTWKGESESIVLDAEMSIMPGHGRTSRDFR
jgi:predicted S18 family serine protease